MSVPVKGVIHTYAFRKVCFEFSQDPLLNTDKALIVIGGLTDGILTVPYHQPLSVALSKHNWSVFQIEFTSSHSGWGTGSLNRDSEEIHQLIEYLLSIGKKKIGIMGHSTGCQNVMHYFTRFKNTDAKFGIMQAPVSDRAALADILTENDVKKSLKLAQELISQKKENEIMPSIYSEHFFGAPISAYRWNSLFSVRGDDDFFSDDLNKDDWKTTFGNFNHPYLVLYSGDDEFVPSWVDKEKLMENWKSVGEGKGWSNFSKILYGAKHNLGEGSKPRVLEDAIKTVVEFITSCE